MKRKLSPEDILHHYESTGNFPVNSKVRPEEIHSFFQLLLLKNTQKEVVTPKDAIWKKIQTKMPEKKSQFSWNYFWSAGLASFILLLVVTGIVLPSSPTPIEDQLVDHEMQIDDIGAFSDADALVSDLSTDAIPSPLDWASRDDMGSDVKEFEGEIALYESLENIERHFSANIPLQ